MLVVPDPLEACAASRLGIAEQHRIAGSRLRGGARDFWSEGGGRDRRLDDHKVLYPSLNVTGGDQMNMDEMGGSCSAHGRDLKCLQDSGWKISTEETS
jgi:hypothetical protein